MILTDKDLERGRYAASVDVLEKLAAAFGIEAAELIRPPSVSTRKRAPVPRSRS